MGPFVIISDYNAKYLFQAAFQKCRLTFLNSDYTEPNSFAFESFPTNLKAVKRLTNVSVNFSWHQSSPNNAINSSFYSIFGCPLHSVSLPFLPYETTDYNVSHLKQSLHTSSRASATGSFELKTFSRGKKCSISITTLPDVHPYHMTSYI